MDNKVSKLLDTVLDWWKEHEYDTVSNDSEEYNVYDKDPEFVSLAKQLKNKL